MFQPERIEGRKTFHVFRSVTDAAIWRSSVGLQRYELREVLSERPFEWKQSRGMIHDLQLASHPFEIFGDHRFEPAPNRAFLAPTCRSQAA